MCTDLMVQYFIHPFKFLFLYSRHVLLSFEAGTDCHSMKLSLTVGHISFAVAKALKTNAHKERTLYYSFAITPGSFPNCIKKSITGFGEAQICIKE